MIQNALCGHSFPIPFVLRASHYTICTLRGKSDLGVSLLQIVFVRLNALCPRILDDVSKLVGIVRDL